jgi:hypothetical protein
MKLSEQYASAVIADGRYALVKAVRNDLPHQKQR